MRRLLLVLLLTEATHSVIRTLSQDVNNRGDRSIIDMFFSLG